MSPVHTLLVQCEPGLHALQLAELSRLGYEGEIIHSAKLRLANMADSDVIGLNYQLRQTSGIYILLLEERVDSLASIRQVASQVDYSTWLHPTQSFRIEAKRIGEHAFGSMQIAATAGQAVVDQFLKRRGVRIAVNLDAPDVTFHVELFHDRLFISVNTSAANPRNRHPRPYQHPAKLRPTIAAAMLELSSFNSGKPILDPMAGGGTIVSEACFIRKQIPAGYFRQSFAFQRLLNFNAHSFADYRAETTQAIRRCDLSIGACDRSDKALRGMRQNIAEHGIGDEIRVWEGDAESLKGLAEGHFRLLISNPPFGFRSGTFRKMRNTYDRFPQVAREKGIDEIVIITPHDDWLIESAEKAGFHLTNHYPFKHGILDNNLFRLALNPNA